MRQILITTHLLLSSFYCLAQVTCSVDIIANNDACYVGFDANPTTQGNVIAYYWEFGDGDTSSSQYPYHTYANGGDKSWISEANGFNTIHLPKSLYNFRHSST